MENNPQIRTGGIGFAGLLTIVFIVLKLLNKIDWSWWWVLSPILISWGLVLTLLLLIGLGMAIAKWKGLI